VDAVEPVGVHPAHAVPDVLRAVREVEHAALAEQDLVAELLLQSFPQLERVLVDARALVPQVVGPDDRGVAGHVAAGQPALLQHRHVGDPVVLGEVVRGGEAVPATAHDHHVVAAARLRIPPEPAVQSHALTLSGFASTHFLAASSGDILSSAMYLATTFWSSF